ncbi:hypothetical protein H6G33_07130 [Calothrix sp. FACHB-1219]|uniref:hypothetical protein n=1 Tax=unclassified Calothrix TaxID=2619626 RepID=UPI0016855E65|nr:MULTISPECIES: hypothetical protein [unclassified Calothrix]MBD2204687.1 hypothetical protein [Calothrix sp. FACHB-168]MBD2216801.1 hypothetical protein [Calothrix sp. FACHB-1219]
MVNRLRKLTPKPSGKIQPRAGKINFLFVKPQSNSQLGNWLISIIAIAALFSSAGLLIAFSWISILFIFNPEKIIWLNKYLPEWAQITVANVGAKPQTLKQIKASLIQKKLVAGEIIALAKDRQNRFLLPVIQQRVNCQLDCQVIVEMRVYQESQDVELQAQPEKYYHLVSQLAIAGPDEAFVRASNNEDSEADNSENSLPLSLNELNRFTGETPLTGIWFDLQGKVPQGAGAIAYGKIVYYDPQRHQLHEMLAWKSPNGQVPKWQQVTGDATKELVIDQTVGLEPQIRVYQVKSAKLAAKSIHLAEISLKTPFLPDNSYQDALLLARNGLWTPAYKWLKSLEKQRKQPFPPEVQGQMALMQMHSQITKSQADQIWAIPSQEVLADLIDGRWEKALEVFAASAENVQEIATLLQMDGGRLWNRTTTALRVNPNRPEVAAWGALILAVQRGEERAISWLQAQPKISADTLVRIQELLVMLNNQGVKPRIISTHLSRIIGAVQPITKVVSTEWLRPNPQASLQLSDSEVWYQVEVSAFHDGKRWLNFPFANLQLPKISPAKYIWETLGIYSDPEILLVVWLPNGEQQIATATIQGIKLQDGALRLLVAGEKIAHDGNNLLQPQPLALTDAALEWVQPSPLTVEQLAQQDPARVKAMLPTVWRTLQKSGQIPLGTMPSLQQMQQQLSYWPVQVMNLTNNSRPETILTISAEAIALLKESLQPETIQPKNLSLPRTIILSDSGKVLYTDFQSDSEQALTAIAKLANSHSLSLLVENGNQYSLKRWSQKNQRFE